MRHCLIALLALPLLARAAPAQDQWFTVLLDGRKIGSFESKREVRDAQVITLQKLDMTLDRAGSRVALSNAETSIETADGTPLAFRSVSKPSGSQTTIQGTVHGDTIDIAIDNGGETRQRRMPWPKGALLAEGARLAGVHAGLEPGTRYRVLSFQPSSLDAVEVTSVVGATETVALPGGDRTLNPVEQTIAFPGAPVNSRTWVDAQQTVHKLTMPAMGVELTLLACDRPCATAPNQDSDVFERTLAPSPRALDRAELGGTMRYTLSTRDQGAALVLPVTDEQAVSHDGSHWTVTVARFVAADPGDAKPPADDYLPNDWLQSTAPEIEALARRATVGAVSPEERMRGIESFVRGYIRTKSLGVGYASALEVARKPEGDCTEHAVLVAALGRASGIATRVVDGLAYAQDFAGRERVFVPHAWAQAFVDGRWRSFDAALPGFDAGHIALAVGDGDPWRFYSGLEMLGRIRIERAEPVPTGTTRRDAGGGPASGGLLHPERSANTGPRAPEASM